MTIGLSNSAKRSSNYGQTTNQNQGGGSKKAGFPYQIGRGWRSSIALNEQNAAGSCTKLKQLQTLCFTNTVHQSRNIGSSVTANIAYYHIPGLGR
jgi:hypothetical protein